MSDIDHLPVRPNINNHASVKPSLNASLNTSHNTNNLFSNSKDTDVQFINKKRADALKIDPLKMDIPLTKEERIAKGVKELRDKDAESEKRNEGSSWIIIILAVIIIILIMIIVYYVINYNRLTVPAVLIPESVVKPSTKTSLNTGVNKSIQNNVAHGLAPKAKNFVDPTKDELNDVLKRLNTINKEPEPIKKLVKIEEVEESDNDDKMDDIINAAMLANNNDDNKLSDLDIQQDELNILRDDCSDNEDNSNNLDPDILEEFEYQADE